MLTITPIAVVLPLHVQNGATPAHIAAQNNHIEALALLCKNGADVNKAKQVISAQPFSLP